MAVLSLLLALAVAIVVLDLSVIVGSVSKANGGDGNRWAPAVARRRRRQRHQSASRALQCKYAHRIQQCAPACVPPHTVGGDHFESVTPGPKVLRTAAPEALSHGLFDGNSALPMAHSNAEQSSAI